MTQQTLRFEQFFAAPRPAVFAYFADHERFGRLWPGRTRVVREAAPPHPHGLGSVREIRAGGSTFEETITAFDPPGLIEYRVTRGSPIKNHRGRLVFTEVEGGTKMDYTIEFDPKIPFTGGLIASVLRTAFERSLPRAVEDLAKMGSD